MNAILEWKQSRTGLLIIGTIELILFYIFGSLAIDSASYWQYILAILFFVGAVQSYFRAIRNNGRK